MKEIRHHVSAQIYNGVRSVNFVVCDAIDTKYRRVVVCVDVGLVSGGWLEKTLKVCHQIKVKLKFAVVQIKT